MIVVSRCSWSSRTFKTFSCHIRRCAEYTLKSNQQKKSPLTVKRNDKQERLGFVVLKTGVKMVPQQTATAVPGKAGAKLNYSQKRKCMLCEASLFSGIKEPPFLLRAPLPEGWLGGGGFTNKTVQEKVRIEPCPALVWVLLMPPALLVIWHRRQTIKIRMIASIVNFSFSQNTNG